MVILMAFRHNYSTLKHHMHYCNISPLYTGRDYFIYKVVHFDTTKQTWHHDRQTRKPLPVFEESGLKLESNLYLSIKRAL